MVPDNTRSKVSISPGYHTYCNNCWVRTRLQFHFFKVMNIINGGVTRHLKVLPIPLLHCSVSYKSGHQMQTVLIHAQTFPVMFHVSLEMYVVIASALPDYITHPVDLIRLKALLRTCTFHCTQYCSATGGSYSYRAGQKQ